MPAPTKIPFANPHALGTITEVSFPYLTVEFSDIPANLSELRGAKRRFQLDLEAKGVYQVGDWVVASWGRNPRINPENGALRIDGQTGRGTYLRTIQRALKEPHTKDWLKKAEAQLSQKTQTNRKQDQGGRKEPSSTKLHEVISGRSSIPDPPSRPWLPTPIGLPQMDEEWSYPDSYLRLGYIAFHLTTPAEQITIEELTPVTSLQVLRSRSPIHKNNWHAQQQVTISLTFSGNEAINQVLLPLVRLFDRVPFLPVFNHILFEHGITALTLQNLQISTVPGFPNVLQATLSCLSFNWEAYHPSAPEFSGLDHLFCYPLLKLWVEKPIPERISYTPIASTHWDGSFRLLPPSEDWLRRVADLPALTKRVKDTNDVIENAKQARRWKKAISDNDGREGFRRIESQGAHIGRPGDRFELDGDLGRAIVSMNLAKEPMGRALVFLRVRTIDAAWRLVRHSDTLTIIRDSVVLTQYTLGRLAHAPLTPHEWRTVSREEFLRALEAKDPTTLENLRAGLYTFVIEETSPVIDQLAEAPKVDLPLEPENVEGDESRSFDPPSFVLEQISCSIQNIIAGLQPRGLRTATHQYLGSQPRYWQIRGTLTNDADRGMISNFVERLNELARLYRGKVDGSPFGGFAIVENELFQLLGTRYVIPLSWSCETIPQFPGTARFTMAFVEFDPTQRRQEALQDLMEGVVQIPILATESQTDKIEVRYVRQRDFHRRLRAVELYPDLALPTHSELAKWVEDIKHNRIWNFETGTPYPGYEYLDPNQGGTGWQWSLEGEEDADGRRIVLPIPEEFVMLEGPPERPRRFADPDFYCAPSQFWGESYVESAIRAAQQSKMLLYDPYGTEAQIVAGQRLNEQAVTIDPQDSIAKAKQVVAENRAPRPVGASVGLVDKALHGNIPTHEGAPSSVVGSQVKPYTIPSTETGNFSRGSVPINEGGSRQDRINHYGPAAAAAARKYNLPLDLFFAQIEIESDWKATATSSKGARGLVQIMPETARKLGVRDLTDPVDNLFGAARYLRQQLDNFNGDERLALAAYNAGPGAVRRAGNRIPAIRQTQEYVVKVITARSNYRNNPLVHPGVGGPVRVTRVANRTPEVIREARQLQREFNAGNGFHIDDLRPFVIGLGDGDPQRLAVTPGINNPNLRPFIPIRWLTQVYEDVSDTDISKPPISPLGIIGLGPTDVTKEIRKIRSRYYVVKPEHIFDFVEAMRRNIVAIPTRKIPYRTVGQYKYEHKVGSLPHSPPTIEQIFYDPHRIDPVTGIPDGGRDIFHDCRKSMIQGRLLGAFPTFYIAIVDGGRSLRVWRLFDHVYGMTAVTKIAIHRTRKGPIETAIVGFANMYGHLTAQQHHVSKAQTQDTRQIWTMEALRRGMESFIRFDRETINMWAQRLNQIMLHPGARLHIRLGYGSDASELPICFNGVITEVPVTEGELEIVALSDGIELTNDVPPTDIQGSTPVTRITSWLGEGVNPRELVTSYLAPVNIFDIFSQAAGRIISPIFYFNFRNAYGIEHFGSPIRGILGFDDSEAGINVYNPESSSPHNTSTSWDSTLRIMQPWRWDKMSGLIGINMTNATPWAVMDTTRRTIPDYVIYPAPFEMRSTLFMGKPWFPFFYKYRDNIEVDVPLHLITSVAGQLFDPTSRQVISALGELPVYSYFEWKPFQQFHLVSSDWNLIGNEVVADSTEVYTKCQAVGTYNGWLPGSRDLSAEQSFVMMVDEDIFDEKQRMKVVESGLYTTFAMKGGDAAAGVGGVLGGLITALLGPIGIASAAARPFLLSRRVMDHYAASILKDSVKEMYQGPLVVIGNPYIKPYDVIGLADHLSGMNGLCEVRETIHTMGLETGFVTSVIPDCLNNYLDYEGRDLYMWLGMTAQHLIVAAATSHIIGSLSRKMSASFVLRGVRRMQRWLDNELKRARFGKFALQGITIDEVEAGRRTLQQKVNEMKVAFRQRNSAKLQQLFGTIFEDTNLKKVFDKAPNHIKLEIQVQQALRSIPGRAGTKSTTHFVGQILQKINQLPTTAAEKVSEKANDLTKRLNDSRIRLFQFGKTEAEIEVIRKAARAGKVLSESDRAVLKAADEVRSLTNQLQRLSKGQALIQKIPAIGDHLKTVLGSALSSRAIFVARTGLLMALAGSISDYIVRWAIARQCLTIFPLRIYELELTAGIDGHRGAVVGDRLGNIDQIINTSAQFVKDKLGPFAGLVPLIGPLIESDVDYNTPKLPSFIGGVENP